MKRLAVALLLCAGPAVSAAQDLSAACASAGTNPIFKDDPDLQTACKAYYLRLFAASEAAAAKGVKDTAASDAEAALDAKRENRVKDLEYITKLRDEAEPAAKTLPDLAPFKSAAQRQLAELAYAAGLQIGGVVKNKGVVPGKDAKLLISTDPAMTARWISLVDPEIVKADLLTIQGIAGKVTGIECPALPAPTKAGRKKLDLSEEIEGTEGTNSQKLFALGPVETILVADAAIKGIAMLASSFQPSMLGGSAIEAPANLGQAFSAGVTSVIGASAYVVPPAITNTNTVVTALRKADNAIVSAETALHQSAGAPIKPNEVFNKACYDAAKAYHTAATGRMKALTTVADPILGSPVEQAARADVQADSKITHVLEIQSVVAGGAVTGYQRNRFSAVKLISGSDIAGAYRLLSINGTVLASGLHSTSKGRAIPLGEFDAIYPQDGGDTLKK